ncbi:MAG TPA: ATP-binding protein [Candidatus Binatia bacterium]|nr:ATP-binding protein [Candidatus Binatia bacterium]
MAIAIAGAAALLAARTTATSLDWVGRVFPGFMVIENRVIAAIGLPSWNGARVENLYLHELVSVDGRPLASADQLARDIARRAPGTPVRYEIRRHGDDREVTIATQRFERADWTMLFGVYLWNGVVFLAAGLLAWSLSPLRPLPRAFLAFGASCALFLFTAMDLYGPWTFFDLHLLSEALVPAAGLQLLLLFPVEHRLARWRFAGYPIALLLFALLEVFRDRPAPFLRVFDACALYLSGVSLFFGLRQILEYRRATSALARQRVRVVTLGTVFGLALPGLIVLVSLALGRGLGMNAIAFTFFLFPVALSYAIVKHDLFEIDAMVKRAAYYLVLTGAVGVLYAGGLLVLNLALQSTGLARTPAVLAAFTVAVLVAFNALRSRLQGFVDRVFFRTRYDGARVLAEVGEQLASALRHDEISALVHSALGDAIPNLGVRLFFTTDEDGRVREIATGIEMDPGLAAAIAPGRILTVDDPAELFASDDVRRSVREALRGLGAAVAVPMRLRNRTVGVLAIGTKRSGLFYTAGDAQFLLALAHQTATALQNAASYEKLVSLNAELEDRVAQRTSQLSAANADLAGSNAELERAYADLKAAEVQLVQSAKMASLGRLAAGVAHEINNPVSFIASNLEPLRSRLDRAAASPDDAPRLLGQARELLDVMAKGAERTIAVVRDLRSFSRINEARRKNVDLREGLDVTIRLLETRWRDRIAIRRSYADVPPVECEPSQINQVFMNLIANACDAIDGAGEIFVDVAERDAAVVVAIRDSGRGIPREQLERIFDPFFTSKDVGEGTGLGLAIVHGIVAAHGGRVEVDSAPGAGSTFRVFLPCVPAARQVLSSGAPARYPAAPADGPRSAAPEAPTTTGPRT